MQAAGTPLDFMKTYPNIIGQAAGAISEVLSAEQIVHEMVRQAWDVCGKMAKL